jgi:hypothetical protein
MNMSIDEMQQANARLEVILALVQAGDGDAALTEIREMVDVLRATSPAERDPDTGDPPSSSVIAAHLKAAEVQIEQTHMSPAEDSITKAIYAATHPVSQAAGAELNV